MGPPSIFRYAQRSSWASGGDLGELPIGAWATLMIARCLKLTAQPHYRTAIVETGSRCWLLRGGFLRHGDRCPMAGKKSLAGRTHQADAPSAHRRPGYSSSGCTPAEPDSASPGEPSLTHAKQASIVA